MAVPLIDKIRRNFIDPELTESFVDEVFQFAGIEPEQQERMKKYLVEILLKIAGTASDLALVALWNTQDRLESIIMLGAACSRGETRKQPGSSDKQSDSPIQIILPDLSYHNEVWVKFVMAHELAHCILRDWQVPTEEIDKEVSKLTEQRATLLAVNWGFPPIIPKEEKKLSKRKSKKGA